MILIKQMVSTNVFAFRKVSLPFSDLSENTLNNIEFTIQDVDKALRQTKRNKTWL